MIRRAIFVLALIMVFSVAASTLSLAQTDVTVQPDAGVRGSGAIVAHDTNAGAFDINVARFGTTLAGGFKYMEITPDGRRAAMIYSQTLSELRIDRGSAVIRASGFWNGMASDLTVEVLDSADGDRFHIVAVPVGIPTGPTIEPYDQGGPVVRGDIVVFSAPPVPDAFAKGYGTIYLSPTVGRFEFGAVKFGDVVKGSISYVEFNPLSTSPIARPRIAIYCPAVQALTVTGNVALLTGKGMLNGHAASIEVEVADNSVVLAPQPIKDFFHIRATPLNPTSTMPGYQAEGYLRTGEIVVGSSAP